MRSRRKSNLAVLLGPWRFLTRPRLAQCLLLVCGVSVTLNVFLFTSSRENTPMLQAPIIYDQWAAGIRPVDSNTSFDETQRILGQKIADDKNDVDSNQGGQQNEHIKESRGLGQFLKSKLGSVASLLKGRDEKPEEDLEETEENKVNYTELPDCPKAPSGLLGPLKAETSYSEPHQLLNLFPEVEKGGRLRPSSCKPKERLAVIIPYRNRWTHLHYLLRNLLPIFLRQQADATVFVIEQALNDTFNRGALLNVGFLEAVKLGKFDCFVFHDVDLIPLSDKNMYRCGPQPRHYAVAINTHNFKLPYRQYFGGVVGMSREQYVKVNGNSNLYFGWGGEDDDLAKRLTSKNYTIARYDLKLGRYEMLEHKRDKGNEKNGERKRIMNSTLQRQDIEGLSTTIYKVNSIRFERLYTWINVTLNMKQLLETAPANTRRDMWRIFRDLNRGLIK